MRSVFIVPTIVSIVWFFKSRMRKYLSASKKSPPSCSTAYTSEDLDKCIEEFFAFAESGMAKERMDRCGLTSDVYFRVASIMTKYSGNGTFLSLEKVLEENGFQSLDDFRVALAHCHVHNNLVHLDAILFGYRQEHFMDV